MPRHNAVTDPVRGGYRAHCLDCDWKGPKRPFSQVVREDIARRKAEETADEDSERHSDESEGRR